MTQTSKMNQSFPTWSFDNACNSMEWTEVGAFSMSVTAEKADVKAADLVILGVYAPSKDEEDSEKKEEEPTVSLSGMAQEIDEELSGALTNLMLENAKAFKHGATVGSTTPTLRVFKDAKTIRYVVMGMGTEPTEKDEKKPSTGPGFAIGKAIASTCDSEKKVTSCSIMLPAKFETDMKVFTDISSSLYQTLYSDNRYRTGDTVVKKAEDLTSVKLVLEGSESSEDLTGALETGKKIAHGIFLAKDIVNAPHNVLNSVSLAETAKRIAAESGGRIECTILGKEECEERGMGSYLGVARGSETPPQFIHLKYSPPDGKVNKKVGIVGKGLLFDTGGYNIKTGMMELMKFDCGGAASVLGAARAVAAVAPPGVEAHFVVAACENMINDKAIVPSDILTASNGKTIEVLNTDAEGRLTLADALVYTDKEVGAEKIIELSTLTGSCMVALGKKLAGVFTEDDDLAKELEDVSKVSGDKSWRMPMESEYNELLKSKIADLANIGGGRWGGAITAALFLQNFVSKKKPFAHIDLAGPIWNDSTGATGYGPKLVFEWIRRQGVE